jgi:hypothetical protein
VSLVEIAEGKNGVEAKETRAEPRGTLTLRSPGQIGKSRSQVVESGHLKGQHQ